MKKVLIDFQKLDFLYCGLGQFCLHLLETFEALPHEGIQRYYLINRQGAGNIDWLPQHAITLSSIHKVLACLLPKSDLWHMTHQDAPYIPSSSKTPVLLTIHDLNFLNIKSKDKQTNRLKELQKKIDRACHITTISHATKEDVLNHCIVNKPITVIPNGVAMANPSAQRPSYCPNGPFLLTVCDITEKKNCLPLLTLLDNLPGHNWILAGKNTSDYAANLMQQAKSKGLSKRCILPGIISDSDKAWLYRHCDAYCSLSKAEGFGLPVIEALDSGAALVLSDLRAHHEFASKWAAFTNSEAPEALLKAYHAAKAIERDASLQEHLKNFTWQSAAKAYTKLYHNILYGCVHDS